MAAAGLRRDWQFELSLQHRAARAKLTYFPQWYATFLDPDALDAPIHPAKKYTAVRPFFAFRDLTASQQAGEGWAEVEKQVQLLWNATPAG